VFPNLNPSHYGVHGARELDGTVFWSDERLDDYVAQGGGLLFADVPQNTSQVLQEIPAVSDLLSVRRTPTNTLCIPSSISGYNAVLN